MFISNYLVVIKIMTEKENKSIVEHWVSLLYLKNYLATLSSEELCEFASDFNFFNLFLEILKLYLKRNQYFYYQVVVFWKKFLMLLIVIAFSFLESQFLSFLMRLQKISILYCWCQIILNGLEFLIIYYFKGNIGNEKFVLLMILSSLMLMILLYLLGQRIEYNTYQHLMFFLV